MDQPKSAKDGVFDGILDTADFRQLAYGLFAGCLLDAPSQELFNPFFGPRPWKHGACGILWPEIQNLCRQAWGSGAPELLAREHAALFVVPGPRNTRPWQTDHDPSWRFSGAAGESTSPAVRNLRMQRLFAEWGFSPDGDGELAPDHAGVAMAFLAHLVAAERARWEVDFPCARAVVAVEVDFLSGHVWNWFPAWLECLYVQAGSSFFRSLALVLGKFLETEKATVEALCEETAADPNGTRRPAGL